MNELEPFQDADEVAEHNSADISKVLLFVFFVVSGVTSFAFFFVYLGNLFPNVITGDAWLAAIISGVIGFLCFEFAAFAWLRAYLRPNTTSQQRTIALQGSIAGLVGGTIASFVWVMLSGLQLIDLTPQARTSIGWLAVVSVSVAISFHLVSAWRYTKNSHQARVNQMVGKFQAKEQAQMEKYEHQLADKINARMQEKLDRVADQVADYMSAQQVAKRMKRIYGNTAVVQGFEQYLADGRHAQQTGLAGEDGDGEPVTAYDDLQALVDDLVRERLAQERAAQPVTPAPNGHGANFTNRPGGRTL